MTTWVEAAPAEETPVPITPGTPDETWATPVERGMATPGTTTAAVVVAGTTASEETAAAGEETAASDEVPTTGTTGTTADALEKSETAGAAEQRAVTVTVSVTVDSPWAMAARGRARMATVRKSMVIEENGIRVLKWKT